MNPHAEPILHTDLGAITANVRRIRSRIPGTVMAVVKADGFGHAMVDVAAAALSGGATRFGVTSIAEALQLRSYGFQQRILSWLNTPGADFQDAIRNRIELAVPSIEHLNSILKAAIAHKEVNPRALVNLHLHLDTDMARDGCSRTDWPALCQRAALAQRAGLVNIVGIMGHMACAAEPDHQANLVAKKAFRDGLDIAYAYGINPADRHLAATAATLSDPQTHYTMSRIGAGLVGIDESKTTSLTYAQTLTAPLVHIRDVEAGTGVGYGHTWVAPSRTRLALLPLGYADGLPRSASNRAEVLVAGRRRPLVGRISMDSSIIDLGPNIAGDEIHAGQIATIFGPGDNSEPTIADWAWWADTLEHEIVTSLGARITRTVSDFTFLNDELPKDVIAHH